MRPVFRRNVPLAPRTTLGLGGPAEMFVSAQDEAALVGAIRWASEEGVPVWLLGGGSNVVVADAGLPGLVIHMATRGISVSRRGSEANVVVAAGEPWDPLVARTVDEGLTGLECLSGIPGSVGATPIQNVGAYGREVAEVIERVRVLDRESLEVMDLTPEQCGFAYRDSALRRAPGRWVVLEVAMRLEIGGPPRLRYRELAEAVARDSAAGQADARQVRAHVLRLRRSKSMVIEPDDPNRRSAGSFFTNPIVSEEEARAVAASALALGVQRTMPQWPAPGGTKLAAGWLIEAAGFTKGQREGPVGLSSRHALAVVHHGGGTTAELLDFTRKVRDGVRERLGVELRPEPMMLGVAF